MDYTFDNMRRSLICGWGELGARTADTWLRYNDRFFRGELKPLPVFLVQIAPFGHSIGLTCARHLTTHIALCRPHNAHRASTADRGTLLHEMIHAWLNQRGESPKQANQPWRSEIMRLHYEITGKRIVVGRSRVTKVRQADGTRKSVRVQDGSLSQAVIARWPHSCGIDLGAL